MHSIWPVVRGTQVLLIMGWDKAWVDAVVRSRHSWGDMARMTYGWHSISGWHPALPNQTVSLCLLPSKLGRRDLITLKGLFQGAFAMFSAETPALLLEDEPACSESAINNDNSHVEKALSCLVPWGDISSMTVCWVTRDCRFHCSLCSFLPLKFPTSPFLISTADWFQNPYE